MAGLRGLDMGGLFFHEFFIIKTGALIFDVQKEGSRIQKEIYKDLFVLKSGVFAALAKELQIASIAEGLGFFFIADGKVAMLDGI